MDIDRAERTARRRAVKRLQLATWVHPPWQPMDAVEHAALDKAPAGVGGTSDMGREEWWLLCKANNWRRGKA